MKYKMKERRKARAELCAFTTDPKLKPTPHEIPTTTTVDEWYPTSSTKLLYIIDNDHHTFGNWKNRIGMKENTLQLLGQLINCEKQTVLFHKKTSFHDFKRI